MPTRGPHTWVKAHERRPAPCGAAATPARARGLRATPVWWRLPPRGGTGAAGAAGAPPGQATPHTTRRIPWEDKSAENEEVGEDSTVGSPTNVLGDGGFEPTICHTVAWWVAARPYGRRRVGRARSAGVCRGVGGAESSCKDGEVGGAGVGGAAVGPPTGTPGPGGGMCRGGGGLGAYLCARSWAKQNHLTTLFWTICEIHTGGRGRHRTRGPHTAIHGSNH